MLEPNANDAAAGGARGRGEKPPRAQAETAPAGVPHPPSSAADEVETLYVEHRSLLLFVACRKFRIPDCDAENLIQEVFLSFLQNSTKIDNIRAWLVAAMCNASRHYWRSQGRTESLPENFVDHCDPTSQGLAEQYTMRMTVHQALNYLQPRCRETLWLHYFEGRSASDVARELETTNRYAEKLIHNCLKRAREIYLSITSVTTKDGTP
ncbi:MAG TPA: sigma-70 family RNA polymerase sigma factor [Thermoanaerobaculia bacterium]|nr:sigma-70 family RNA polymerase sigma factor [Thermoanaerobaculia bacterium]